MAGRAQPASRHDSLGETEYRVRFRRSPPSRIGSCRAVLVGLERGLLLLDRETSLCLEPD
jgi:hypothetical protein